MSTLISQVLCLPLMMCASSLAEKWMIAPAESSSAMHGWHLNKRFKCCITLVESSDGTLILLVVRCVEDYLMMWKATKWHIPRQVVTLQSCLGWHVSLSFAVKHTRGARHDRSRTIIVSAYKYGCRGAHGSVCWPRAGSRGQIRIHLPIICY